MGAPDPRKQAEEARLWIVKADEDVATAQLVLTHPHLHGIAAFHCQQAAEKLMKAALVAAARPVRKTHDLDRLASEVTAALPGLAAQLDPLRRRTAWIATFRYPGADDSGAAMIDRDTLEIVLGQIAALRAAVVGLVG
jgi:HEPN domain-containing protein